MKKILWLIPALFVFVLIAFSARNKIADKTLSQGVATRLASVDKPSSGAQHDEELRSLGYGGSPASPAPERKIIRNGEVNLVVKHYEPFFNALQKEMSQIGAYIAQIQVNRSAGNVSSASIVLRLPPQKLLVSVSWLREQGIITSEKVTAEEITEQYYDLQARLSNARKFESRLLEMLQTKTGNLSDLVQVEEKLNQVREQIEQMEGKLRYFDNLINLATLTLNVSVEETFVPPHPPNFMERTAKVWRDSLLSLFAFSQGVVLVLVGITPWIVPMALMAVFSFYLFKGFRRILRSRENRLAR